MAAGAPRNARRSEPGRRRVPPGGAPPRVGVPRLSAASATAGSFLEAYGARQVLYVSRGQTRRPRRGPRSGGLALLRRLYAHYPRMVERTFCLEASQRAALGEQTLTGAATGAVQLFGSRRPPPGPWYASFVVQRNRKALEAVLAALPMDALPFPEAGTAAEQRGNLVRHADAAWIFVGRNATARALHGRPEHTDAIQHSGTWHVQLRGSKVWMLRPTAELCRQVPGLNCRRRLRVRCEVGDVLCVNTRLWHHHTYLPGGCGLSISVARDMYLDNAASPTACDMTNVEGHYATRCISRGTVIATERDMPDMQLPREQAANCELGELEDGSMALVARRAIRKGEWFSLAPSDDSEEEEEEKEATKRRRR